MNQARSPGWPPNWNLDGESKLWQYNLHYFEWLWALDYADGQRAVVGWMDACSPLDAPAGWEPYPISLRVVNWCAFFWHRHRARLDREPEFQQRLWTSVYQQMESLRRRLEYHLLGNHLFENAAALAFAGCCFAGRASAQWLEQGRLILRRELTEQMLPDGMHFERSSMYHSRLTYLLLLLRATGNEALRDLVQPYLAKAIEALQALCHPDGRIALFNDSAFGIANEPPQLLQYAKEIGLAAASAPEDGPWSLPAAGYYGYRKHADFYLVCDAGPVGPDYIPGHAHGDIFSFELSCRDHRIVVDSGVYDYVPSDVRQYCRSTRAHNTVTLNGQDQCEFWGAFRVSRRAHLRDIAWLPEPPGFRLQGWHDGYQRLPGRPRHARLFAWHRDGVLMVRDEIDSAARTEASSRIHLHPDCQVASIQGGSAELSTQAGPFAIRFAGPGALRLEDSIYCPEFGRRIPNQALAWTAQGRQLRFGFCLAPGRLISSFDLEAGATINRQTYPW